MTHPKWCIVQHRGTKFGNPYALECDENGEIKTRIYYCDLYCSWQKGMIEKNHEFIRMFLPKGKSFDDFEIWRSYNIRDNMFNRLWSNK